VWSASESGFGFESDPLGGFGTIGHERNGSFF
jgi:hypothetical protein